MMPKTAFGTGKTISKNVIYSNFSRPESARRILSVIFGTASNIFLHFVASFLFTYKTIFFILLSSKSNALSIINQLSISIINNYHIFFLSIRSEKEGIIQTAHSQNPKLFCSAIESTARGHGYESCQFFVTG